MSLRQEALRELARRELERRAAAEHPAELLRHVSMPDERTAEEFRFQFDPCENPVNENHEGCCWYWQRLHLDDWMENQRSIDLKARQLGDTWLAGGFGLWQALYKPGSLVLVYRQKEADAGQIVERIWEMFTSLPDHLKNGVKVLVPAKGHRPSIKIEFEFPDGRISRIQGQASTSSAGHGETAALVIMDEFARIDAASDLMKAVQPAAGSKGKIIIVSTANGVSNPETGEGNYFHFLWVNEDTGFKKSFLPWWLHPDRDADWYESDPEVRGLRWYERAEQYPSDPDEAFTLTNQIYFDRDALHWYRHNASRLPLYRCTFDKVSPRSAKLAKDDAGAISVYEEPCEDREYAIGADVATGRGRDYSAAYVIDLSTMALVAEYSARIDSDRFAYQLHYLGRWYGTARIAVEMGGGFGEPVIVNLRDGKDGRPAYPNLYRYRERDRADIPERQSYGFPMTSKSRPLVISAMERAIREKSLPWMTNGLLAECHTFVTHETGTSPRAQEGTNDDRVMACAIALQMYREFGAYPDVVRRRTRRPKASYPWQHSHQPRREDEPRPSGEAEPQIYASL